MRAKRDFDWSVTGRSNWALAFVFNKSRTPGWGRKTPSGKGMALGAVLICETVQGALSALRHDGTRKGAPGQRIAVIARNRRHPTPSRAKPARVGDPVIGGARIGDEWGRTGGLRISCSGMAEIALHCLFLLTFSPCTRPMVREARDEFS